MGVLNLFVVLCLMLGNLKTNLVSHRLEVEMSKVEVLVDLVVW
jgi:hypothetical protein